MLGVKGREHRIGFAHLARLLSYRGDELASTIANGAPPSDSTILLAVLSGTQGIVRRGFLKTALPRPLWLRGGLPFAHRAPVPNEPNDEPADEANHDGCCDRVVPRIDQWRDAYRSRRPDPRSGRRTNCWDPSRTFSDEAPQAPCVTLLTMCVTICR